MKFNPTYLCALLLFTNVLCAQQHPLCDFEAISSNANELLGDATYGDFDGDGDLDVVALGFEIDDEDTITANGIELLLNNGDGTFFTADSLAVNLEAIRVISGDVDGDDDLDLVVSNSFLNTVSVLLNNGNAEFAAGIDFPLVQDPMLAALQLSLVDIDGDDDDDLLVTSVRADPEADVIGTLSILINDGSGDFGAASSSELAFFPSTIEPLDFDNDGDLDLLIDTNGLTEESLAELLFMENDGNGNFTIDRAVEIFQAGTATIEITDVDADSFDDIMVSAGSSSFSILYGTADGFEEEAVTNSFSGLAADFELKDLDDDLDLDVIISSGRFDRIGVLINNGDRNFTTLEFFSMGLDAQCMFQDDFTGDGESEFLIVHSESMELVVTSITCEFSPNDCDVESVTVSELDRPGGLAVADFNGDGLLDLATAIAEDGLAIQLNNGDGSFAVPSTFETDGEINRMVAGDIDGDGDIDLVSANFVLSNSFSVFENDGNGDFSNRTDESFFLFGLNSPNEIELVDLDGDSDLDAVICVGGLSGSSSGFVYRNQNGSFQFADFLSAPGFTADLEVADFDRDGDMDLVFNDIFSAPASVFVFFNNGNAFFSIAEAISTNGLASSPGELAGSGVLAVGDFNNDMCSDIIVADRGSNFLTTLLGRGDGTFDSPVLNELDVYQAAKKLEPVDVDGDGDLDLLVANGFPNNVLLALNDGDGNFDLDLSVHLGDDPFDIVVADFDNDSVVEAFISHTGSNSVEIATFSCNDFLLGDVNQDGFVTLLDISPFVDLLVGGLFQAEADINQDGVVDLLDVAGFVELLTGT